MTRYIIGIDLGTTNSCVAYIDTQEVRPKAHPFIIPQIKAPGSVEPMPALPSFCYLLHPSEWSEEEVSLPWRSPHEPKPSYLVGVFARSQGGKVPTRLVRSAKSWLCHHAANRSEKILPIESSDESIRISPIEAASRYLRHMREAWNWVMAKGDAEADFDQQEVVLTVPASFDEAARTLTVEAAKRAGFTSMSLIEEPQAAFYSWLSKHETDWDSRLSPGMRILVCDVGGGTTDFSIIETAGSKGALSLNRMAVGDHLLLGGDNMDAAVMHWMESTFEDKGEEFTSTQRLQLLYEARRVKEEALSLSEHEMGHRCRVVIQGSGSKVVGGTATLEVDPLEVRKLLLDGFFTILPWNEALKIRKASGLRTMGLPYEDDPSITKHLAKFLNDSKSDDGIVPMPDLVLFNGGAMKPALFQEAILSSLKQWFPAKEVKALPPVSLDLAVALGAAYYGRTRRGEGVKIGGGLARGCYLVIETIDGKGEKTRKALTLLPRGSEEGDLFEPERTFMLKPNVPVSFQLCSSHVRRHDAKGDLVAIIPEEMQMLPPIHTILRQGRKQAAEASQEPIPVKMQIALTAMGTIEIVLKAVGSGHRWALEFQLRSASGQEDAVARISEGGPMGQTFEKGFLDGASVILRGCFSPSALPSSPTRLMEKLEEALAMPRSEWPVAVLRGLFDEHIILSPSRKISTLHWERWWNVAGFLLRPGFGYALDDFRCRELWKIVLADVKSNLPDDVQTQLWIAYRRFAGGMSKGQQLQVGADLMASVIGKKGEMVEIKSKAELYPFTEKVRALGALELLDSSSKMRFGHALAKRIVEGKAAQAEFWALGRLGARHLMYGSIAYVLPSSVSEGWIEGIIKSGKGKQQEVVQLAEQLARRTSHKELNVSPAAVGLILSHLKGAQGYDRLEDLLMNENKLTRKEQDAIMGDHLPLGLHLEVE